MPTSAIEKETTNKKVIQGQVTVVRLLSIAQKTFAERGYAATRTQDIIDEAGVTKGALYHHFPSKSHLFEAVYRSIESEMGERISTAAAKARDPWDSLLRGCFAYLESSQEREWQRILRVDGPAVLGLETWAKIDREYGLDRLLPFLKHLKDTGIIQVPSVEAFGRQLTGAMNEATFWIAQHEKPKRALAESKKTLRLLLEGVRPS